MFKQGVMSLGGEGTVEASEVVNNATFMIKVIKQYRNSETACFSAAAENESFPVSTGTQFQEKVLGQFSKLFLTFLFSF